MTLALGHPHIICAGTQPQVVQPISPVDGVGAAGALGNGAVSQASRPATGDAAKAPEPRKLMATFLSPSVGVRKLIQTLELHVQQDSGRPCTTRSAWLAAQDKQTPGSLCITEALLLHRPRYAPSTCSTPPVTRSAPPRRAGHPVQPEENSMAEIPKCQEAVWQQDAQGIKGRALRIWTVCCQCDS